MGLLIDSTVLIRAERDRLTPIELAAEISGRWADVEVAISVMSAAELLHGCWRADTPAHRQRREGFVEAVLSTLPIVEITLPIMRVFAVVDAHLRGAGKRLPTSDLLIASTALSRRDEVVTGNARHFHSIPRLIVHEDI